MKESSHHRTAGAALIAALFMVPTVHAQPRDAGIAGGHAGPAKPITAASLARYAGGDPHACDFNHDRRYGPKQAECVIRVVWPRRLEDEAIRIAWCESQMDATPPPNPQSTADGLFQFLDGTWATTPQYKAVIHKAKRRGAHYGHAVELAYRAVRNPVLNAQAALWLYTTGGHWRQWECGRILGIQ